MPKPALSLLFLLVASSAYCQTCTDWSLSPGQREHDDSIQGDRCIVSGSTVYLAGPGNFQIVDLSDPRASSIIGVLDLGIPPVDMVLRGHFVYVLLEGFGIVEIDVQEPTTPIMTRAIDSPAVYIDLADLGQWLGALDDQSRLHYYDLDPDLPLAESHVVPLPLTGVITIGKPGQFLTIWNGDQVMSVDDSLPDSLQVIDSMGIYGDSVSS